MADLLGEEQGLARLSFLQEYYHSCPQVTLVLCRVVLNWNLTPGVYKHEKKSDLHQSIWPEGFYDVRPVSSAVVYAC